MNQTNKCTLDLDNFNCLLGEFNITIDDYIKNELICNLKVAKLSTHCIRLQC